MIIYNCKINTWDLPNQLFDGHSIRITGSQISEIGPENEVIEKYPDDEKVDAGGQLVMPGNICAHTHFYGTFSRGLAIPGDAPKAFPEILEKLWWGLDRALSLEDVRYSALVCIIDAIRHGTTTLIDHHASPNAIHGSLNEIAEAVRLSGIRGCLCYEVTDRNGMDGMLAGVEENIQFLKRISRSDDCNCRLAGLFGLHASLTLSDKTLEYCTTTAPSSAGFHIHIAEHESDQDDSIKKSGIRVVDRLDQFGILQTNSILVHAVHLDAREIQLIAKSGGWVTHQPRSNMNNGVGLGDVESMLRAGVRVGLGNDGFSNSMWEEWKTAYLVHKLWNRDPRRMNGNTVVDMAVYQNSSLVSTLYKKKIGVLVPGAQADLIFVDYKPFTELTAGNIPWHILFGFHDDMVTNTMVAGKFLMRDRKLITLDENEILNRAYELSRNVYKRYYLIMNKGE